MTDPWDYCQESEHTARKEHRCDECYRKILPGERYRRVWGIQVGEPTTIKTCAECNEAAAWYCQHCDFSDEGWVCSELHIEIAEQARLMKSFEGYRHVVRIRRNQAAYFKSLETVTDRQESK